MCRFTEAQPSASESNSVGGPRVFQGEHFGTYHYNGKQTQLQHALNRADAGCSTPGLESDNTKVRLSQMVQVASFYPLRVITHQSRFVQLGSPSSATPEFVRNTTFMLKTMAMKRGGNKVENQYDEKRELMFEFVVSGKSRLASLTLLCFRHLSLSAFHERTKRDHIQARRKEKVNTF